MSSDTSDKAKTPSRRHSQGSQLYCRDCVRVQLQHTPGAPVFIPGDLNHCKLDTALSGYGQCVKGYAGDKKVSDERYGNMKEAHTCRSRPPLSNSDHKSPPKRHKPGIKSVNVWSNLWEVVSSALGVTVVTTDYIKYCTGIRKGEGHHLR